MPAALTLEELQIVEQLTNAGESRPVATLAVAMVTREHARPQSELIDILRQYQGLEGREDVASAIATLKATGWLIESVEYGATLVRQVSDLRKKIADRIGIKSIERTLGSLRSANDPSVSIVGSMTDETAYSSFLDRLSHARSAICLPMLATTSKLKAAEIIKQRAAVGVKVRVLLASTDVVCRLRGNTMANLSAESIAGWREHSRQVPNFEVRLTSHAADMRLASCAVIDGEILRVDVYDPNTQRSLQGTLIEVTSINGRQPNIISLFQEMFDDAWHRAAPSSISGRLRQSFGRNWQWVMFALFGLSSFATKTHLVLSAILGSASASFLANAIVGSWPAIISMTRRLVRNA